jgi:hypothetical protein
MASTDYRDYINAISGVHNDTLSLHNLRDIAELVSFIIDQFSQQTPGTPPPSGTLPVIWRQK